MLGKVRSRLQRDHQIVFSNADTADREYASLLSKERAKAFCKAKGMQVHPPAVARLAPTSDVLRRYGSIYSQHKQFAHEIIACFWKR